MNLHTDIALMQTIEEICGIRDKAIAQFEHAQASLRRSEGLLNSVAHYVYPWEGNLRLSKEKFIEHIDERLWRHAFDKTGLMQYMDKKARREFEDQLKKKPPAFTVDNCRQNLLSAASNADEFFVRGLVEFFLGFSKGHKTNTNEPFKVSRKAILRHAVSNWYGLSVNTGTYSNGSSSINDMDRVIKTLDGKKHEPRELETAINAAWKNSDSNIFEDDYYRIKGFKNGNMHIEFKRQDLLDKANKLISQYYEGQALAEAAA